MRKLFIALTCLLLVACGKNEAVNQSSENKQEENLKQEDQAVVINETNLYNYLNQADILYLDIRETSEYQEGHLEGFVCLPFNSVILGTTNTGSTLYYGNNEPSFKESDVELEKLVPKDKEVYVMCRSGHRAGLFLTLLEARGYDMSKIHNVGGMMLYTASEYDAYKTKENEVYLTYDFSKLTKN